jgi:Mg2+/Co2+ transporter CorB
MIAELITVAVGILILILLSAFFSGSETALTAASRPRIHHLARKGNVRAKLVNRLDEQKERLIGGILLGNNMVNILASALATAAFVRAYPDAGVLYATVVMTSLILIFAEVLPKTYAISNPSRVALAVAPAINIVVLVLSPVVAAVQMIVRLTLRVFGVRVDRMARVLSPTEELRHAIDLHARESGMVKRERNMLESVLDLAEVEVGDVMVHRKNMLMINADDPASEIVETALNCPFTRIPLWRDEPENIIGVLHAKDVLRSLSTKEGNIEDIDFASVAADPWFVPETTTLREQLSAFLAGRAHFALVVDEYGSLMGLVTLEDVLEEIVGDIRDEHDAISHGIRLQSNGSYLINGDVTIRDLNRHFEWELPDEDATTIAGLVIERAQSIPDVGQRFVLQENTFEVVRRNRNQITALRVTPRSPPVLEADEA